MADFIPLSELQPDDATIRGPSNSRNLRCWRPWPWPPATSGILRPENSCPTLSNLLDPEGGWTPEQRAGAGDVAFEVLKHLRDHPQPPPADVEHIRPIMETLTGATFDDTLLQFLGLRNSRSRASTCTAPQLAQGRGGARSPPFTVGVIGAGMSRLLAAYRLQQAGVPYVVFEKNADVGGTWLENSYPGCRVDVGNLFYSYSFAQRADWPHMWSTQGVARLLPHLRRRGREDLRPQIALRDRRVRAATWSDDTGSLERSRAWATRQSHGARPWIRRGRRPAQPAQAARTSTALDDLRRTVVPLGPLGQAGGLPGKKGGRNRQRVQRHPTHPGDRRAEPRQVSIHLSAAPPTG